MRLANALLLSLFLFSPALAFGQGAVTGTIAGRIVDASGLGAGRAMRSERDACRSVLKMVAVARPAKAHREPHADAPGEPERMTSMDGRRITAPNGGAATEVSNNPEIIQDRTVTTLA